METYLFPIGNLCDTKRFTQQQLQRTLDHLSTFCKKYKRTTNKPWILTIDDADNLKKSQFLQIYNSLQPLINDNLLTIVIISSDPAFAAFVSDKKKFKNISRFQMDEMDETESTQFLESQPCQLFVNRMRKHYGNDPLNKQEISKCYTMAGGIPLWLIQCGVQSPDRWYQRRVKTVTDIIDQQENSNDIYKMQQYMVDNNKSSGIGFREFIKESGSVDNAIKLLHGIPRPSKHNRLFFHDLNRNNVSLQYQYLKQMSILSQKQQQKAYAKEK